MSNAELALLLFIILTVGHYAVVWSIYLEKQLVSDGAPPRSSLLILVTIPDIYFSHDGDSYFSTCSLNSNSCAITSYCLIYFYAENI